MSQTTIVNDIHLRMHGNNITATICRCLSEIDFESTSMKTSAIISSTSRGDTLKLDYSPAMVLMPVPTPLVTADLPECQGYSLSRSSRPSISPVPRTMLSTNSFTLGIRSMPARANDTIRVGSAAVTTCSSPPPSPWLARGDSNG